VTNLDLLTVFCMAMDKTQRSAAIPAEYDHLSGLVQQVIDNPISALQKVLASELGIAWDGKEKLHECVLREQKELCRIAMAERQIDGKIAALTLAKHAIRAPNIAGRDLVLKCVEVIEATETK
jgi:hypothetical protein